MKIKIILGLMVSILMVQSETYVVTISGITNVFTVQASGRLEALLEIRPTVWTLAEWNAGRKRSSSLWEMWIVTMVLTPGTL